MFGCREMAQRHARGKTILQDASTQLLHHGLIKTALLEQHPTYFQTPTKSEARTCKSRPLSFSWDDLQLSDHGLTETALLEQDPSYFQTPTKRSCQPGFQFSPGNTITSPEDDSFPDVDNESSLAPSPFRALLEFFNSREVSRVEGTKPPLTPDAESGSSSDPEILSSPPSHCNLFRPLNLIIVSNDGSSRKRKKVMDLPEIKLSGVRLRKRPRHSGNTTKTTFACRHESNKNENADVEEINHSDEMGTACTSGINEEGKDCDIRQGAFDKAEGCELFGSCAATVSAAPGCFLHVPQLSF
jgi:hypothetical protein